MMLNRKSVLPIVTVAVTVSILLWIWTRFAQLWIPSLAVYAGLLLLLAGLVSVAVPLRFVGVNSRRQGALLALAGVALGAAALLWPSVGRPLASSGPAELDRVMPAFDRTERHEVYVQTSCMAARRAAENVSFSDVRGLQTLFSIRAGKSVRLSPKPILATMTGPTGGFSRLSVTDAEFVAGNAGRPWKNERSLPFQSAEEFRSFAKPGYAKVAFNLRFEPAGANACKVTSETRVLATDDTARRAFTRYWRVIYPGSALARVLWLDAVQRRAGV